MSEQRDRLRADVGEAGRGRVVFPGNRAGRFDHQPVLLAAVLKLAVLGVELRGPLIDQQRQPLLLAGGRVAQLAHQPLEVTEHRVEGDREPADLVERARCDCGLQQISLGDPAGDMGDAGEAANHGAGDHPGDQQPEHDRRETHQRRIAERFPPQPLEALGRDPQHHRAPRPFS